VCCNNLLVHPYIFMVVIFTLYDLCYTQVNEVANNVMDIAVRSKSLHWKERFFVRCIFWTIL